MKLRAAVLLLLACLFHGTAVAAPLGLPPLSVPADNPQTAEKVTLGETLFHDTRFSPTGEISCATCHDAARAFTDGLPVSRGINGLEGTRNAPTVVNAAYMTTQFWDGREPSLEAQAAQPFLNPVEFGLPSHGPILEVIRSDPGYVEAFDAAFCVPPERITMEHVKMALASFQRTLLAADSPFDRYLYGGEETALDAPARRGLDVFRGAGRCVSCHTIEQDHALFTDNRFHNIGVGFKKIHGRVNAVAAALARARAAGADLDRAVLTQADQSELGRFAVTHTVTEVGAFKTPTLRNVALTAPYMHDGSLATLEDVVEFYDKGGRLDDADPVDDFLSGGIRPLGLTPRQKTDLVAFMEALTSPRYRATQTTAGVGRPQQER